MNDKVIIKFNILGTGENEAVFTFDEKDEETNIEKFAEAMTLVFPQIILGTKTTRALQLNNMRIDKSVRAVLKKGAGEDHFTVEFKKKEENNE